MLKNRSLRWQLALTYAGIALLTAALLGGILMTVLGRYYIRAEDAYLQAAADQVTRGLSLPVPTDAAQRVALAALRTQTRVRVYDTSGELLYDSGSPQSIDPGRVHPGPATVRTREGRRAASPALGGGIFGGSDSSTARSSRQMRFDLTGSTAAGGIATLGYLVLSEAPASGRDVLVSITQGWIVAAAIAVRPGGPRRIPGVEAHLASARRPDRDERPDGRGRPERAGPGRPRGRGRPALGVVQHDGRTHRDNGRHASSVRRGCRARDRDAAHGAPGRSGARRGGVLDRRRAPARAACAHSGETARGPLGQPAEALADRGGRCLDADRDAWT